jgi:predicted alpha-1,6-mannanase (GH76 family)
MKNMNKHNTPQSFLLCWLCVGIAALTVWTAGSTARAYTTADANTIMNAYNTAFFVDQGTRGYYKDKTNVTNATWFWGQAEEIEALLDAYERTGSSTYYSMISKLCNGFTNSNQTSWTWNEFNDDIMWAVIAFTRAYQKTGNTTFRTYAKNNFDACYSRAWDTAGGGGLWWTTAKTSKTSCVNFPAAVAAYHLYQALGDSSYLTKCQTLFDWGKANLYNSTTGRVFDSTTNITPSTYNQGTFVGTAHFLGDVTNATLATNYTKNSLGSAFSPDGYRIMPQYDPNSDGGGFNGICIRWIAKFMGDRNLQNDFLPWLRANAQAAWDRRRTSDNLSWSKWGANTPEGEVMDSFGCMSSVVALQTVPAHTVTDGQYAVINRKSGKALHPSGGGTANGTALVQLTYTTSTNMRWAVEGLGAGQYRLRKVTNTRYATLTGGGTGDTATSLNDWLNVNHQKFTFTGNHGPYYSLIFVHSGKALTVYGASMNDNAAIIQYAYNGGNNAQWQFRNP